jgi:hypothetical protein
MANWAFLPNGAVAVHIRHQPRYYTIHDWGEDLVRVVQWNQYETVGTIWRVEYGIWSYLAAVHRILHPGLLLAGPQGPPPPKKKKQTLG